MIRRTIAIALLASLAGGCASPPTIARLGDGESVQLVVAGVPSHGDIAIRNASLGKNVGTGASTGSVAGGLWGLACGPFAILCVPVAAGLGAIAGSAGGAVVGATASLSDEQAAQLQGRMNRWLASHDLVEQLRANVVERARRHWNLASDPPGFVLSIDLGNVELTSTRDEQVGLLLRAHASLQRAGAPPAEAPAAQDFVCTAPSGKLAIWLDEGSDFVDTVLGNCTQQLAAQLVAEMARK